MLPSKGYFNSLCCPFHRDGICKRPYCHFRHFKKDCQGPTEPPILTNGTSKSLVSCTLAADLNLITNNTSCSASTLAADSNFSTENTSRSESVVQSSDDQHLSSETALLSSSVEEKMNPSVPSYKPTPLSELRKRHIPVTFNPDSEKISSKNQVRKKKKIEYVPKPINGNVPVVDYTPTPSKVASESNSLNSYNPSYTPSSILTPDSPDLTRSQEEKMVLIIKNPTLMPSEIPGTKVHVTYAKNNDSFDISQEYTRSQEEKFDLIVKNPHLMPMSLGITSKSREEIPDDFDIDGISNEIDMLGEILEDDGLEFGCDPFETDCDTKNDDSSDDACRDNDENSMPVEVQNSDLLDDNEKQIAGPNKTDNLESNNNSTKAACKMEKSQKRSDKSHQSSKHKSKSTSSDSKHAKSSKHSSSSKHESDKNADSQKKSLTESGYKKRTESGENIEKKGEVEDKHRENSHHSKHKSSSSKSSDRSHKSHSSSDKHSHRSASHKDEKSDKPEKSHSRKDESSKDDKSHSRKDESSKDEKIHSRKDESSKDEKILSRKDEFSKDEKSEKKSHKDDSNKDKKHVKLSHSNSRSSKDKNPEKRSHGNSNSKESSESKNCEKRSRSSSNGEESNKKDKSSKNQHSRSSSNKEEKVEKTVKEKRSQSDSNREKSYKKDGKSEKHSRSDAITESSRKESEKIRLDKYVDNNNESTEKPHHRKRKHSSDRKHSSSEHSKKLKRDNKESHGGRSSSKSSHSRQTLEHSEKDDSDHSSDVEEVKIPLETILISTSESESSDVESSPNRDCADEIESDQEVTESQPDPVALPERETENSINLPQVKRKIRIAHHAELSNNHPNKSGNIRNSLLTPAQAMMNRYQGVPTSADIPPQSSGQQYAPQYIPPNNAPLQSAHIPPQQYAAQPAASQYPLHQTGPRNRTAHTPNLSLMTNGQHQPPSGVEQPPQRRGPNQQKKPNPFLQKKTNPFQQKKPNPSPYQLKKPNPNQNQAKVIRPKQDQSGNQNQPPATEKEPPFFVAHLEKCAIPLAKRIEYLHHIYSKCLKYFEEKDAKVKAVDIEKDAAAQSKVTKIYQYKVAHYLNYLEKTGGKEIEKQKEDPLFPSFTFGKPLYDCFLQYVVKDLFEEGIPVEVPDSPFTAKMKILYNAEKKSYNKKRSICLNCGIEFDVDEHNLSIQTGCKFHKSNKKKLHKVTQVREWNCCADINGCMINKYHIRDVVNYDSMPNFVKTPPCPENTFPGIYALDCEMCYTTNESELARVVVLDHVGQVVYESYCQPLNPILDYCTEFSGVSKEHLVNVKKNVFDIQEDLLKLFNDKTILVGHGIGNDLRALKIIHTLVVDTAVVFPRRLGHRRKLKHLASEYLKKVIQESGIGHCPYEDASASFDLVIYKMTRKYEDRFLRMNGHCPYEDAVAALDLMIYKIKEDRKAYKPRNVISVEPKKKLKP